MPVSEQSDPNEPLLPITTPLLARELELGADRRFVFTVDILELRPVNVIDSDERVPDPEYIFELQSNTRAGALDELGKNSVSTNTC